MTQREAVPAQRPHEPGRRVSIRLLGPLDVVVGGGPGPGRLPLGPFKQRVLLAMLLCQPDRVVPVATLIDALWPENPPRTAQKNIHVYVSHLRRMLDEDGDGSPRIEYRTPGYVLMLGSATLDTHEFDRLARAGRVELRRHRPAEAARALRRALDLWRDTPLADLLSVAALKEESDRLLERCASVCEDWLEAQLSLGQLAEVLDVVERMVRDHPMRERLRSIQMTALYRAGRQAEALHEYDNLRRVLAQELGLEPSPALHRLYRSILDHDPTLGVPTGLPEPGGVQVVMHLSQLPRDVEDFTAREEELHALQAALDRSDGSSRGLVTISGQPGVGKTALAVKAAQRLRDRFPDGHLFLPFRVRGRRRTVSQVLSQLLRDLGLPDEPPDDEGRAALLRAWLAERCVLIITDDAATEDDVRPLLPAAGPSAVLVTSRTWLGALESALHVPLGPLAAEEAVELLEALVGPDRVRSDPVAAARIVDRCDHLPLAVRIAGARLAHRPHLALPEYADRLVPERVLDELEIGDLSVRAALRSFVEELPPLQRQAVIALGDSAPLEVTPETLAGALGLRNGAADHLLERLTETHVLLACPGPPGHVSYRMPGLVAAYARECGRNHALDQR